MNEKERYEQVRAVLSLVILPAIKETTRKTNILFLLNLGGIAVLITLMSVSIVLLLRQGV